MLEQSITQSPKPKFLMSQDETKPNSLTELNSKYQNIQFLMIPNILLEIGKDN